MSQVPMHVKKMHNVVVSHASPVILDFFVLLQLRKLIHEYPILLMPTHRSYMDFLLVSYIFYDFDLPLPVIAAAMGESSRSECNGIC